MPSLLKRRVDLENFSETVCQNGYFLMGIGFETYFRGLLLFFVRKSSFLFSCILEMEGINDKCSNSIWRT